jgi:hypothetical protein
VLKLLRKWLQAGVMDEGRLTETVSGTPQGGVISPLPERLPRKAGDLSRYSRAPVMASPSASSAPHFPTTRASVSASSSFTLVRHHRSEALARADLLPAQLARRGLAVWLADDQIVAGLLGVAAIRDSGRAAARRLGRIDELLEPCRERSRPHAL